MKKWIDKKMHKEYLVGAKTWNQVLLSSMLL